MKEYMINIWWSGLNNGTTPFFRTTSRQKWLEKIKEAVLLYDIRPRNSRIVKHPTGLTVFSATYSNNVLLVRAWKEADISKSAKVTYGFPEDLQL